VDGLGTFQIFWNSVGCQVFVTSIFWSLVRIDAYRYMVEKNSITFPLPEWHGWFLHFRKHVPSCGDLYGISRWSWWFACPVQVCHQVLRGPRFHATTRVSSGAGLKMPLLGGLFSRFFYLTWTWNHGSNMFPWLSQKSSQNGPKKVLF